MAIVGDFIRYTRRPATTQGQPKLPGVQFKPPTKPTVKKPTPPGTGVIKWQSQQTKPNPMQAAALRYQAMASAFKKTTTAATTKKNPREERMEQIEKYGANYDVTPRKLPKKFTPPGLGDYQGAYNINPEGFYSPSIGPVNLDWVGNTYYSSPEETYDLSGGGGYTYPDYDYGGGGSYTPAPDIPRWWLNMVSWNARRD